MLKTNKIRKNIFREMHYNSKKKGFRRQSYNPTCQNKFKFVCLPFENALKNINIIQTWNMIFIFLKK